MAAKIANVESGDGLCNYPEPRQRKEKRAKYNLELRCTWRERTHAR